MRKNLAYLFLGLLVCSCTEKSNIGALVAENDSLKTRCTQIAIENEKLKATVLSLRDSINQLSFPADQRYAHIASLVKAGDAENARREIAALQQLFPNSREATDSKEQTKLIEQYEEAQKKEAERLKALGFKAFTDQGTIRIDDSRCTYSDFRFGREFAFEFVDDEYSYDLADKNNTYILASLAIYSEGEGESPTLHAYKISDGKLVLLGTFNERYASYSSYGVSIGLYRDDAHDWDKVNTMKFKIACEISKEAALQPVVVAYPKTSDSEVEDELTLDEAKEFLEVIKILNRNKL